MATTPQGDEPDVRRSVVQAMAREVARRRLAQPRQMTGKPKKLMATYSLSSAMPKGMQR
jgi:hypothetical protein